MDSYGGSYSGKQSGHGPKVFGGQYIGLRSLMYKTKMQLEMSPSLAIC